MKKLKDAADKEITEKIGLICRTSQSATSTLGDKFTDEYKKDYFMEGYTDEMVAKIIKDVGWEAEFEEYCKKFN